MSLDLRTLLNDRLGRLQGNLGAAAKILARRPGMGPDPEDLPGLAWLLESSYSDMEEVWKGIARHFGETLPNSTSWHRDLLDSMAASTQARANVISPTLRDTLEDYLSFRHFARYSTFAVLSWAQMQSLVLQLPEVVHEFREELSRFTS